MCYDIDKKTMERKDTMLPQDFLNRMQKQLGQEYPAFLQALERPRAVALRFNPLKGGVRELPFLQEQVPWENMGYYYDITQRPGLHPYHDAGVYYLQEASAMAPVALLDPQPGEKICDLCAAPGGKSTQIAGRLMGEGFLLCNEINPKRAKILSRNIERMGIANALVTNEHPQNLEKRFQGFFDRVLVDAPCSGEGMFRKEEAAVTDWSVETVQMCANRQQEILHTGAKLLRPGGRLVYSTCTFAPEENEQVIEKFLQTHPDFTAEAVNAPWFTAGPEGTYRMWPHKLLGEGHFAAVLRRSGAEQKEEITTDGEPCPKLWKSFAEERKITLPQGKFLTFGQSLYWAPREMPALHGLKVLRPGLELGQIKKDRFEPAHALALWLTDCAQTKELTAMSREVEQYLMGNVIPGTEKGWCLVRVDGVSLGWCKGDGSMLKNHYPKGLRRMG